MNVIGSGTGSNSSSLLIGTSLSLVGDGTLSGSGTRGCSEMGSQSGSTSGNPMESAVGSLDLDRCSGD